MNSLHYISIILTLSLLHVNVNAQNKVNENGLKHGKWVYRDDKGTILSVSHWKIRPFSKYVRVINPDYPVEHWEYDPYRGGFTNVLFYDDTATLYFQRRFNDLINVQDGLQQEYDTLGRLKREEVWNEGILFSRKEYNSKGELIHKEIYDYINDSFVTVSYRSNRVFSRHFESDTMNYFRYYPDDNIIISSASLSYDISLCEKKSDTNYLYITCKSNLVITEISLPENFTIQTASNKKIRYPFQINKNDTLHLNIIYNPTAKQYVDDEDKSIYIITDTAKYLISQSIDIDHVCRSMFKHAYNPNESIDTLTVSLSQDKYLLLPKIGSINSLHITDVTDSTHVFSEESLITNPIVFTLSALGPGIYNTIMLGCEDLYLKFKLIITE